MGTWTNAEVSSLIAEARERARAEVVAELTKLFADELRVLARRQLEAPAGAAASGICLVGVVGSGGAPAGAETVDVAGLRALVAEIDQGELDDPALLERHVRAHNDLLLAALELGPVVPVRFGTFFASSVEVAAWLERNESLLLAELARLRGTAEWALTVLAGAPAPAAAVAGSSSSYLERRSAEGEAEAGRRAEAARLARDWHEQLLPLAEDSALAASPRAGALLEATYLVARSQQDAFGSALARVQAESAEAGLEARLTGPWPPFSFAGEGLR